MRWFATEDQLFEAKLDSPLFRVFPGKLLSYGLWILTVPQNPVMINQHKFKLWLKLWLSAGRQQAITFKPVLTQICVSILCPQATMNWIFYFLTPWGRGCLYASLKWVIFGSGNGLLPVGCQAITWNKDDLLSIGPLGTNFSETLLELQTFLLKKMQLKMSHAKWRSFCLGLNVLK